MSSTNADLVAAPADLMDRLRVLKHHRSDADRELVRMVGDVLAAAPADTPGEHTYGFLTTLRGVLRVTAPSRADALAALAAFQAVDSELSDDGAQLTEVSFIPGRDHAPRHRRRAGRGPAVTPRAGRPGPRHGPNRSSLSA